MRFHLTQAVSLLLVFCLISACGGSSSSSPAQPTDQGDANLPQVSYSAIYSVQVISDIVYGQGLSHDTWNGPVSTPMDLLLDLYLPVNNDSNRPALVFIHGGSFTVGDKANEQPVAQSMYFAERGFVVISINYRLLFDYGTLPEDVRILVDSQTQISFADREKMKARYAATRDAKAAVRWLRSNAGQYGVHPDYISAAGASAGASIAIALGVTEPTDFLEELSQSSDLTITSTNPAVSPRINAIVDFWGAGGVVGLINSVYGIYRWDSTDAPIAIIHGTNDETVDYQAALNLEEKYLETGVTYELYTLEGAGHSAWDYIYQGRSLSEIAFDFVVRQQNLRTINR